MCRFNGGAGLALTLKKEFPKCYDDYIEAYITSKLKLGDVIISKINNDLDIIHVCGQYNYKGKKPLTNYDALERCFIKIQNYLNTLTKPYNIYFPYKFGCGLAGGNWNIVEGLINNYLPNSIIIKYNG